MPLQLLIVYEKAKFDNLPVPSSLNFHQFKNACKGLFLNLNQQVPRLRKLLTENFQIIGEAEPKTRIG